MNFILAVLTALVCIVVADLVIHAHDLGDWVQCASRADSLPQAGVMCGIPPGGWEAVGLK